MHCTSVVNILELYSNFRVSSRRKNSDISVPCWAWLAVVATQRPI